MQLHHEIIGSTISIEYIDGTKGTIKATVSDERDTSYINDKLVSRSVIIFNVIKDELIAKNLPIKGFKIITYNREKFEVKDISESSTFGTAIKISCVKFG